MRGGRIRVRISPIPQAAAAGTFALPRHIASRSHAVPLLQLFALTVMVIPSDTVIKAIGAEGYAAALIGMFAFAAFLAATLLGLHDPLQHRHPVRSVLCLLWLSVFVSYILMDRGASTVAQVAAADRLLMQLAVITGVALVAAECLTSLRDVRRVLRALTWGGAFCGVVATLQFWVSLDITPYLRELPGFSINFDNPAIVGREALNRVAGTSITAIELGVVAGMLLPLAIYLGIYDKERSLAAALGPRRPDRARNSNVRVAVGDHLGRARMRGAGGSDAHAAAAGSALCGPLCGRRGLHVGARRHRHPHVVLQGRHQRRLGGGSGVRLPGGRAPRVSGAMVRPRRRDLHGRQRLRHSRQSVPEDRDRARPCRARCAGSLFPGSVHFGSRRPAAHRRARAATAMCRARRRRASRGGLFADIRLARVPDVLQCLRLGDRVDRSQLATRRRGRVGGGDARA